MTELQKPSVCRCRAFITATLRLTERIVLLMSIWKQPRVTKSAAAPRPKRAWRSRPPRSARTTLGRSGVAIL